MFQHARRSERSADINFNAQSLAVLYAIWETKTCLTFKIHKGAEPPWLYFRTQAQARHYKITSLHRKVAAAFLRKTSQKGMPTPKATVIVMSSMLVTPRDYIEYTSHM